MQESEETTTNMIPLIAYVSTHYKSLDHQIDSYWIMGSFPSFQDMGNVILDLFSISIDLDLESEKVSTLEKLKKQLRSTGFDRDVILWNRELILNTTHKDSSIVPSLDPYRTLERLEIHFKNAKSVLKNNLHGDGVSAMDYLARSLENKPQFLRDYSQNELDLILPLTSWNDRQKKAMLTLAKTKNMI